MQRLVGMKGVGIKQHITFFFYFFFLTALLTFYSVTIVINEKLHVHSYEGKKKKQ